MEDEAKISLSRELVLKIKAILFSHQFDYDEDGESYNNEEVIACLTQLNKETE